MDSPWGRVAATPRLRRGLSAGTSRGRDADLRSRSGLARSYFEPDPELYAERSPDAHGKEYWGDWARLVLRRRTNDDRRALLDAISDAAAAG